MINILIIEDDENIAKMIKATLSIVGYNGTCCYDGKSGMEEAQKGTYDLVLLDIMLPEMSGFEVMEHISDCGSPVIFLTAMQDVADKVKGLRLGAEDYIVKPFEALELLARIDVVLRRSNKTQNIITYGDYARILRELRIRIFHKVSSVGIYSSRLHKLVGKCIYI